MGPDVDDVESESRCGAGERGDDKNSPCGVIKFACSKLKESGGCERADAAPS